MVATTACAVASLMSAICSSIDRGSLRRGERRGHMLVRGSVRFNRTVHQLVRAAEMRECSLFQE
jgi:hypothetical protein